MAAKSATKATAAPGIMTLAEANTASEVALEAFLRKAQAAYAAGHSICSDTHFDRALDVMRKRFPSNAWLLAPVKPEGAVAGVGARAGDKVTLPFYMPSLDKIKKEDGTMAIDEMKEWARKHPSPTGYVVTKKVDGCSGMYHRAAGLFTQGSEGTEGFNLVPHIVQLRKSGRIPTNPRLASMTIRGELVVNRADMDRHNVAARAELARIERDKVKVKKADLPQVFRTARSLAVGIVNNVTPPAVLLPLLSFIAYEVMEPAGLTPQQQMETMHSMGFTTPFIGVVSQAELTDKHCTELFHQTKREAPYDCDGIVVAVNVPTTRCAVGKNPTSAVAFKVDAEGEETIVQSIEWNTSRHGLLIPTVLFDMVDIDGVEIRRATGIHARFVHDNALGPGAIVSVIRSGDVIPKIKEIVSPAPDGPQMPPDGTWRWESPKKPSPPTLKGSGGKDSGDSVKEITEDRLAKMAYDMIKSDLAGLSKEAQIDAVWNTLRTTLSDMITPEMRDEIYPAVLELFEPATATGDGTSASGWIPIHAVATNVEDSEEFHVARNTTFLVKIGVEDVKAGTVQKLYKAGFQTLPDILAATTDDLADIEGFKATLASKVVTNIRTALHKATRVQLMVGSCLFGRGVGETKTTAILDKYPDLDAVLLDGAAFGKADMPAGVGVDTFREFLDCLPVYHAWLEEIQPFMARPDQGWEGPAPAAIVAAKRAVPAAPAAASAARPAARPATAAPDITGKAFVFTGFRDAALEEQVAARGGKIGSSVSKKSTAAVVAKDPTTQTGKVKDATAAGIPVLSREEFAHQYGF